jgi:hypothetical protein
MSQRSVCLGDDCSPETFPGVVQKTLDFGQYLCPIFARISAVPEEGKRQYQQRAGVEGTLSQGVRGFGLRYARYRGLTKTHFQQVATAAAMNVDRIVAWLNERPRAKTRTSRFAALAPAYSMLEDAPSI